MEIFDFKRFFLSRKRKKKTKHFYVNMTFLEKQLILCHQCSFLAQKKVKLSQSSIPKKVCHVRG